MKYIVQEMIRGEINAYENNEQGIHRLMEDIVDKISKNIPINITYAN